jgi:hypothetical protein
VCQPPDKWLPRPARGGILSALSPRRECQPDQRPENLLRPALYSTRCVMSPTSSGNASDPSCVPLRRRGFVARATAMLAPVSAPGFCA